MKGPDKVDFEELLNSLMDAIVIIDSKGRFEWVSHQVKDIFGYEPEDVIGMDAFDFIHEEDRERAFEGMMDAMNEGGYVLEYRARHKDGHYIYLMGSGKLITRGDDVKIIAQIKDITDRRTVENELRKKNEFIQTILDNLPIGVATNEFDAGTANYMNNRFQEIYGWPEEELMDIPSFFRKVYPDEEYRRELQEKVLADIESGDPERMHWENLTATGKDGKKRVISAQNIPLINQNMMVSTVWDVTAQSRSEERLKESQDRYRKEKQRAELYLDLLSHDIGNLHQGISTFSQLAMIKCRDEGPVMDFISSIKDLASRSQNMINNVKVLSRIKDVEEELKPTDIQETVEQSIEVSRKMFSKEEIRIDFDHEDDEVLVLAEPLIQNIFVNLIHNGIKAQTGESASMDIRVYTDEEEKKVIIDISDRGPGIPDGMKSDLFERRMRSTKKRHSGIGLSLVKELVERYNGNIRIMDKTPGDHTGGAMFKLTFPIYSKG